MTINPGIGIFLFLAAFFILTVVNSYIYLKRRKNKKAEKALAEQHMEPVRLEKKHLQNCIVLSDRDEILDLLPKGAVAAEVGVLAGDFSEKILARTAPKQLYLMDTFFSNDWVESKNKRFNPESHLGFLKERFKEQINRNVVHLQKGISWEVLKQFDDHFFDWIYVDAGHSYPEVYDDLLQAKRLIKPNGYIIMNDYIFYSHAEEVNYGVIQAVNKLCLDDNFEVTHFALHPQMYCDVVLKRIV